MLLLQLVFKRLISVVTYLRFFLLFFCKMHPFYGHLPTACRLGYVMLKVGVTVQCVVAMQ